MIPKRIMNFCYGMGAAVVIIGALFKITHQEFGPLNGNNMLTAGLIVEAIIFAISAFEPADDEYDWSLVYPELKGGEPREGVAYTGGGSYSGATVVGSGHEVVSGNGRVISGGSSVVYSETEKTMLSEKLDSILQEAKIDANLMERLRISIENFESAAKGIAPTVDAVASNNRYTEEMSKAATQLEALNNLYRAQLESATRNAEIHREVADNNMKLKEQMVSLTSNLSSLNAVYGGMLSAMGRN